MQLVILFITTILISSCLKEPDIYFCVYTGPEPMTCIWMDETKPDFEKPIAQGDICTTPKNFGEAKKHHSDLHRAINERTIR